MGKRKRRRHYGGLIFLFILVILIAAPVGFAYGFLYDNSHLEINRSEISITDVVNNAATDSLDYTTTSDHEVSFRLTQDDLNSFLYDIQGTLRKDYEGVMQYVKDFYVLIEEDRYVFSLEADFKYFATKVSLDCTLKEIVEDEEPYFYFRINDIKIGKINALDDLALRFVDENLINSLISQTGMDLKVDLKNKCVTYKEKDLFKDMKKLLGKSSAESGAEALFDTEMYFAIINEVMDNRLVTFDFNKNKCISINVPLEPLHENGTYSEASKDLNIIPNDEIAKVKVLMDNNVISGTEASKVLDYLLHGYNYYSTFGDTDTQSFIDSLDLTSIGISDNTSYVGNEKINVDRSDYKNLEESITDSVTLEGIMNKKIAKLTEDQINNYLKSTPAIGSKAVFYREKEDGYKLSYILINNFYCNITDDQINYVINICLNGYDTTIVITTSFEQVTGYKIKFKTENVYYGNIEASKEIKDLLFKIITGALKECATIGIEIGEDQSFIYNFEQGLQDSEYYPYIAASGLTVNLDIHDTVTSNGEIEFLLANI